jgi:hypothetical protein
VVEINFYIKQIKYIRTVWYALCGCDCLLHIAVTKEQFKSQFWPWFMHICIEYWKSNYSTILHNVTLSCCGGSILECASTNSLQNYTFNVPPIYWIILLIQCMALDYKQCCLFLFFKYKQCCLNLEFVINYIIIMILTFLLLTLHNIKLKKIK